MNNTKSASRLYIGDDLSSERPVNLSKDQSHYLIRVMRRHSGDMVTLFNGRDGEWQARIVDASKSSCVLEISQQLREQTPEPDIWLAFAPIKKSRLDFMIEKATELGAARLLPVITHHTEVGRINRDRLQATVMEASEQCERLSVPEVIEAEDFHSFIANWPEGRRLFYLDETGNGELLSKVLKGDQPGGFLVGPEGGFSPSELDVLRELPFSFGISLGPRILRTETAALSALANWQSIVGDTCVTRLR